MSSTTMAANVLDVQGLSKSFRRGESYNSLRDLIPAMTRRIVNRERTQELDQREFWALQDVSFTVQPGEAFGIIGGNGAGKSTILKLLTGIMRPTRGSVRVSGRISALIEVNAGFHHDLTGRENVYLNGAILGMTRAEIRRRFDAIVDFSGLEEFIDTPVKRYSSGMFARLGFSVAAHVDPDILLVDEVLSVGDYLFQRKCMERMHTVIGSGATIVFVSHNLREVANLCERSLLLEKGRVQMIGPTAGVIGKYFERGEERAAINSDSPVVIKRVTVHDEHGPRIEFESGKKLRVTVEAQARSQTRDISVEIRITDQNQYPIFDTGTTRLGLDAITLERHQGLTCTFELDLCLAQGTFHVNAYLHRYVMSKNYDRWEGAGTFFVTGAPEARGVVTLHPRLTECRVNNCVYDATDTADSCRA
jgi:lipopolysaccharide transport system ATP-binding protein